MSVNNALKKRWARFACTVTIDSPCRWGNDLILFCMMRDLSPWRQTLKSSFWGIIRCCFHSPEDNASAKHAAPQIMTNGTRPSTESDCKATFQRSHECHRIRDIAVSVKHFAQSSFPKENGTDASGQIGCHFGRGATWKAASDKLWRRNLFPWEEQSKCHACFWVTLGDEHLPIPPFHDLTDGFSWCRPFGFSHVCCVQQDVVCWQKESRGGCHIPPLTITSNGDAVSSWMHYDRFALSLGTFLTMEASWHSARERKWCHQGQKEHSETKAAFMVYRSCPSVMNSGPGTVFSISGMKMEWIKHLDDQTPKGSEGWFSEWWLTPFSHSQIRHRADHVTYAMGPSLKREKKKVTHGMKSMLLCSEDYSS